MCLPAPSNQCTVPTVQASAVDVLATDALTMFIEVCVCVFLCSAEPLADLRIH